MECIECNCPECGNPPHFCICGYTTHLSRRGRRRGKSKPNKIVRTLGGRRR